MNTNIVRIFSIAFIAFSIASCGPKGDSDGTGESSTSDTSKDVNTEGVMSLGNDTSVLIVADILADLRYFYDSSESTMYLHPDDWGEYMPKFNAEFNMAGGWTLDENGVKRDIEVQNLGMLDDDVVVENGDLGRNSKLECKSYTGCFKLVRSNGKPAGYANIGNDTYQLCSRTASDGCDWKIKKIKVDRYSDKNCLKKTKTETLRFRVCS